MGSAREQGPALYSILSFQGIQAERITLDCMGASSYTHRDCGHINRTGDNGVFMIRKNMVIAFLLLATTLTGLSACSKKNDKKPVHPPAADTAVVPKVVGLSYINAVLAIQKAGFYVKEKGMAPFASIRNKPVVSQDPAAGTKARKRTPVKVVVK